MNHRRNGQTRQQELYAYLRTLNASITAYHLAAHEGLSTDVARARLRDGAAAGWLEKHSVRIGNRLTFVFYAVVRPPGRDGRGRHPNTVAGNGRMFNPNAAANLIPGARWRNGTSTARRRCALARAWPAAGVER